LGEIIKDPRRQARATTNMFSLAGVGFLTGPFLASTLFSELRYGFIFAAVLMILGGLLIHLTLFVTLFSGPADKTSTSPSPLALEVQPPALTAVLSEDHVKDQGKRGPLDSLISAVSISPIHTILDSRWPAITSLTASSPMTCKTASSPMTSLNFSTSATSTQALARLHVRRHLGRLLCSQPNFLLILARFPHSLLLGIDDAGSWTLVRGAAKKIAGAGGLGLMKHFDEALMHHFNRSGGVYRCGGNSLWGFLFARCTYTSIHRIPPCT